MSRRIFQTGVAITALGAIGVAAGYLLEPRRTLFAWLAAWSFHVSLTVGSLVLVMIGHAAKIRWFAAVRRLAEIPVAALPLTVLLVMPILFDPAPIYPWAEPAAGMSKALLHERAWLEPRSFAARTQLVILVWALVGEQLCQWSIRQDREGGERLQKRMQILSAAALPMMALTITLAAFDWFMSLHPTWHSTVFGIYWFGGGFVAALALLGLVVPGLESQGLLEGEVSTAHRHAIGKLLFTMIFFWGYIALVQVIIVWMADTPVEVEYFVRRTENGWGWASLALALGQFAIPFLVLLSRDVKRAPRGLALISAWILAAHWLDSWWMVLPALPEARPIPNWIDLAAFLAQGGALFLLAAVRTRRWPLVARNDLYREQALHYRGS